jgi:outer membrane protein OmpA-like peptidoglycan-associated protein
MERLWILLLFSVFGALRHAAAQGTTSAPILMYTLQGTVYHKDLLTPLEGAMVNVVGTDGSSFRVRTDKDGAFLFEQADTGRYIRSNNTYSILVEKEGFLVVKDQISTQSSTESTVFVREYFLHPATPTICRLLPSVYFAQNSFELTKQPMDTLDILVTVLKENPNLVIEVIGYRDSSERRKIASKRSLSVRDHLIARGIHPVRLISTVEKESSYFVREQEVLKVPDAVDRESLRSRNRAVWYKVVRTDWKP